MNMEITLQEIGEIIELLQTRHKIRLPVEIRYSENADLGFCVMPFDSVKRAHMSSDEKRRFLESMKAMIKHKGLTDSECESLDTSKYTIFLSKRYDSSTRMYAAVWEELGHAVAWSLFVRDQKLNGNIAVAYRFWGLLRTVVEGRIPLQEAVDQIESDVKTLKHPLALLSMHPNALDAIRVYNPDLKFRGRDPKDLLGELVQSIDYAVHQDKKRKLGFEKPLIAALLLVILILLIISIIL